MDQWKKTKLKKQRLNAHGEKKKLFLLSSYRKTSCSGYVTLYICIVVQTRIVQLLYITPFPSLNFVLIIVSKPTPNAFSYIFLPSPLLVPVWRFPRTFAMESHYIFPFRHRLGLPIKKFTKNAVMSVLVWLPLAVSLSLSHTHIGLP